MNADLTTASGSRWEPAAPPVPPPPVGPPSVERPPVAPPPAPAVRSRGITGPIVAGALGLAVLTGLGGFALGLAVGGNGTSQVRQDSPEQGQLPGDGQFPGDGGGRFGTAPDDGSNGQGT
ncbi:hypothetical protein [Lentzea sp. NPDC059081]|uniref:hypothetical protein n=1 Tax=Lentzea sp. NPDC059081 TaxID=3346719 RepID=UPI00368865FB